VVGGAWGIGGVGGWVFDWVRAWFLLLLLSTWGVCFGGFVGGVAWNWGERGVWGGVGRVGGAVRFWGGLGGGGEDLGLGGGGGVRVVGGVSLVDLFFLSASGVSGFWGVFY